MSVAQAQALESAKVTLSAPAGDHALIADMGANIALLTAAQIAGPRRAACDADRWQPIWGVSLTTAQAMVLESAHTVSRPRTASGPAAQVQALSAAQLQGLSAIGVTSLVFFIASVKFTVAQTLALGDRRALSPMSRWQAATVTVSILLTSQPCRRRRSALLAGAGFSGVASTSGGVTLSVAQALALEGVAKITVPAGSEVSIADTSVQIQSLSGVAIPAARNRRECHPGKRRRQRGVQRVPRFWLSRAPKIGVSAQAGSAVTRGHGGAPGCAPPCPKV